MSKSQRKPKVKRGVPRRYGNPVRADRRRRYFLRHGKPYTGR